MTLRDYIIESKETPTVPDTTALNDCKHVLELPFLYHLDPIADTDFEKAIGAPFSAFKNAPVQKGKFPLIIAYCLPESYPETFEYLTSHGFVVACVTGHLKDAANDTLLYVQATDILGQLIDIMAKQPYVDTSLIAGIGHGWGIQPPFHLAMRTRTIKMLVNMDGGVFGPRSKTTLSPDYNPSQLKIPMLHLVTQSTNAEDDAGQFNALSNPLYKLLVNSPAVSHHDFSIYGRIVDNGLHKRGGAAPPVEEVYAIAHKLILYFLLHGKLETIVVPPALFKFNVYNKK